MTRHGMRTATRMGLVIALAAAGGSAKTHFLLIEGLGGTAKFADRFRAQVETMLPSMRRTAGEDAKAIVVAGMEATGERIGAAFVELAAAVGPGDDLAVILVGHGTHDGDSYKLNVPGPDVTGKQLARWLDSVPAARQLVVNTTSASGGTLETLTSPRRIVITATKNGRERTATVFGSYWAEALGAQEADTDKNESVSALEAFRYAEAKVKAHFEERKGLATEHPVLQGERAESFLLARLGAAAALADDPAKRELLVAREDLERRVAELSLRKDELSSEEYLDTLQELLLRIAEIQEQIDTGSREDSEERP